MPFTRRAQKQIKQPLTLIQAKRKLMDFVARRDHSEKELSQKLARYCESDIVQQTITWAREQNWLSAPETLQQQFATQLGRRGKGIHNINQKLKELGLESVKADFDNELEKARRLTFSKWNADDFRGLNVKDSQKLRAKIIRFLTTRGYEGAVISSILKNDFNTVTQTAIQDEDLSYDDEY
ncbi:regulatory protein RecX [Pseudobdellovibrio exovorus]|uniref:Regulatory protein RecX n=1 Tax=Pseudobdellovibrio exovorus JSS TaxID=1184267 RepID=M4V5Y2_9BACT|nr:RecX family transcriptional regulator [Pseudobdellovibrio exovorus]AGH94772.1 regulatory protein RecX [Pseudobdellovibrio exovorus JSS]